MAGFANRRSQREHISSVLVSMYILGISCYYHDSSACLLKDGLVVAAAEEERFTRKKHDAGFPLHAIDYCLEKESLTIKDIDHIAFYEKPLLKFERVLSQHLEMFPWSMKTFISSMPGWFSEKTRIIPTIRKKLQYTGDVIFANHHLSHAASAFFPSPYKRAAVLVVDGVGEWSTVTYGVGRKNNVVLKKEIRFPHSLGLLYSTITAYLGFSVNNSEYKVMGLAAYGQQEREKNAYYDALKRIIDIKDDGSFRLDMSYFVYHYHDRMPSKKLCALLGGPVYPRDAEVTKEQKDIAAAVQLITEDILIKIVQHIHRQTGEENLVFAGGVALNSVFNGKVLSRAPFKNVWIQPNASDGGTSLGVAYYVYHAILKHPRRDTSTLEHAYLGPSFSDREIETWLQSQDIVYKKYEHNKPLIDTVTDLLLKDKVVGWFQGGMEWGPRALGARSIIANPLNPAAQRILNEKVKHRELFRPFAPVVCRDDAETFFECDNPIPPSTDFMLMVYPIKEKWRTVIPSVTHVDGSGRLQTVGRGQNTLYYDLIKDFGKKSGVPVLINTSFNIRGEPIVCTPHDAFRCMMGTEIDYLVMGNMLISRGENMKFAWDSEALAND